MKSDKNNEYNKECLKLLSRISNESFMYNNKNIQLIIQDYRQITCNTMLIKKK